MKSTINCLLIIVAIISIMGSIGCSDSASNPTIPSEPGMSQAQDMQATDEHGMLGVYELNFDPETVSIEFAQVRQASAHYDITAFMSSHVSFPYISWDPVTRILDFDMTMNNASVINVFDVRVLFLADPTSGFEFLNPDDYTLLFNPFGPDDVNPFRTYAKTATDRIFAAGASHTENFKIQYPPAIMTPVNFLVECSWPSNCEDVYEISNQTLSNPISTLTHGYINLDAYDHQDNIGLVYVDTTPITGGMTWLANIGGSAWKGGLFNTMGAPAGTYRCRITADSFSSVWNTYDFIDIEVVTGTTPPPTGWSSTDYGINGGCSLDLGVIADPGGPRDSNILMVQDGSKTCDDIIRYDAYYAAFSNYVSLYDYDSHNPSYQPYPVRRIDAADDGAFSFTNENWSMPYPDAASSVWNAQVWSVFDRTPLLHTGPAPDDSRYYFDYSHLDGIAYPVDVCDDFDLGQYALFTTEATYTTNDLMLIGTMPAKYTHDYVRYLGNLDAYAGFGDGLVNPSGIKGIDTMQVMWDLRTAKLYVLEEDTGGMYQVEVYGIMDDALGWGADSVFHIMTISIAFYVNSDYPVIGHDIELLPVNPNYKLNDTDETLCVLVHHGSPRKMQGEVLLYNANTGTFLESIGCAAAPSMPDSDVSYLDTDDGDWEIHVTRTDAAGNVLATVFDYS